MAALSEPFVTIADASVDPDSPITTSLMLALKRNDIHLREWIGASFFAGAEQDHNHDGNNSALITSVGEGIVIFDTAGSPTFNVPGAVDRVLVEVWGAGGGGAGADSTGSNFRGGGGGGGAGLFDGDYW